MNDTEQEKVKALATYLKEEFMKFAGREIGRGHPIPSQAEFAKYLGVSPTSLSNWLNELRPPNLDNVDSMAARLGPKIYIIMGMSARMPKDKLFVYIAENWHRLSDAQKGELHDRILNWVDAL
jgi:DNA-binding XRE family transcriptional regulator